ncbi:hypothetical protein [Amycolatopsis anabasis]|uniref:hypothetical protein n=1 Tax=Amycolatopsis anabasis TaxID=1840409 RepID=UPI00131D7E3A|nr:hypothetical protein [Amycolatopsis anabasis]
MPVVVSILLVLAAGLYVGSRVNAAREAHAQFSSYRTRIGKRFTDWVRSTVIAVLGVAGMVFLVFAVLFMHDSPR